MGRKLRDKLPKLQIPTSRAKEAEWQHLLKERDALAKLKRKEYADNRRSAEPSNIAEGDEVLLRQTRENKLSPAFEPDPYKVIQKEGNAVVIENGEGNRKMRNVAHMKKLWRPEEPETDSQESVQEDNGIQSEKQDPLPEEAVAEPTPPPPPEPPANQRPVRMRQQPVWCKEYVMK